MFYILTGHAYLKKKNRVGQKEVYSCEYAKHRVYSCIIIYYCVVFHMKNCKRTVVPPCISSHIRVVIARDEEGKWKGDKW